MYGEEGYIIVSLTPDQESLVSLQLDVNRHYYSHSKPITELSAAFFDLGALSSTPATDASNLTTYKVLFTRFFPMRWEFYWELLNLLHESGAKIEAYWICLGKKYFVSNSSVAEGEPLHFDNETTPEQYEELSREIENLREWTEITDMYVHIPPPRRSLLL